MADHAADIHERWRPSQQQIDDAATIFEHDKNTEYIYTIHVLLHKEPGWWTEQVEVKTIDGLTYNDRNVAIRDAMFARALLQIVLGEDDWASAGWTVHYRDGTWATFEV
jgi:hypothetical protein